MISLLTHASIHWWQPVEIITQIALLLFYSSVAFVPRWARSTPSLRWVGSLSLLEDFLQLCDRSNGPGLILRLALMCLCFCFLLDVSPPTFPSQLFICCCFFGGGAVGLFGRKLSLCFEMCLNSGVKNAAATASLRRAARPAHWAGTWRTQGSSSYQSSRNRGAAIPSWDSQLCAMLGSPSNIKLPM